MLERRLAMPALDGFERDGHGALRTVFGCGRRGRGRRAYFVDRLHHEEDRKGHNHKIQCCINEHAVFDGCTAAVGQFLERVSGSGFVIERVEQIGKIDVADDFPQRRHDHISHQRRNDLAERRANDDTDGHVNHVALHREFFEIFEHGKDLPGVGLIGNGEITGSNNTFPPPAQGVIGQFLRQNRLTRCKSNSLHTLLGEHAMRRHARAVLTIALFLFSSLVWADVKLPAIISDNMALQQNMCVPIWGWADPGEAVTVCICNQTKSVCTCTDGKWIVKLSPMAAGGPHEMTGRGSNTIIIKNVLIGEVWVCSGQSNMEWVVNNSLYANAEKEAAKHPSIRLFTVKKNVQDNPVSDCTGKWVECSPASVGDFSAVGYFFGRTLYYHSQVPIGLIHTSWGGTPAEAWTTRATLEADPDLKPIMDRYAKAKADDTQFNWDKKMAEYKRAQDTYTHDTLVKWNAAVEKAKAENKAPPPRPNGPRAPQHALNANSPASLYNGMIAPIVPYGIAGATWYQ